MSDELIDNHMDYLQSKCDALAKEVETLKWANKVNSDEWKQDRDRWRTLAGKMAVLAVHDRFCIRSFWEAGEPTENGGYRTKYRGKWYQSKPVDEEPKCECGLAEALALYDAEVKKP